MTNPTPAPSPLPWSIRPCPKHIGKAGKICECIRDASGKEVTDQQIMERINELHAEKAALVESIHDALVMLPASRYDEETNDALNGVRDRLTEALSLARRKA